MDIINLTPHRSDKSFLARIARQAKKFVGQQEISLVLVSAQKIQEINKKYRRQNKPTDVLSFAGLNEIFICPQVVKKQAKEFGVSFNRELARALIHGILHLKGYDHEKSRKEAERMRKLEEKILNSVK